MKTAVVLAIFNRPEKTARVFAEIARARPERLFVFADGPRADHPEDISRCAATRAVVERVNWNCQVMRDYSEHNLGCGARVASGITWAFQHVEEAIILEDDCLPHPSFFPFCEEMLRTYRHDPRIMNISGTNFQFGRTPCQDSYYYSCFPHVWGWATWRRAWAIYDFRMQGFPALRSDPSFLRSFPNAAAVRYWIARFDEVYGAPDPHTWDFQWTYTCWKQHGLSVVPAVNLVSNLGYDYDATHTRGLVSPLSNMPSEEITFPLRHPTEVIWNIRADAETQTLRFTPSRTAVLWLRFRNVIVRIRRRLMYLENWTSR